MGKGKGKEEEGGELQERKETVTECTCSACPIQPFEDAG